jgi:hypothetical protein
MDRVEVKVNVYLNKKTGEEFILRSEEWFEEKIKSVNENEKLSEDQKTNAVHRLEGIAKKHKEAFGSSKESTYFLSKPTFGELQKAKAQAKHRNEDTGEVVFDNDEFLDILISGNGRIEDEDGNAISVSKMTSIPIITELRDTLFLILNPSDERMPF